VPPTRDSSSRRSIFPHCGSCPPFSSARTTIVSSSAYYIVTNCVGIASRFYLFLMWCDLVSDICRWDGNRWVEGGQEPIVLQAWRLCAWIEGNFKILLLIFLLIFHGGWLASWILFLCGVSVCFSWGGFDGPLCDCLLSCRRGCYLIEWCELFSMVF
jgi:hypothetical protein